MKADKWGIQTVVGSVEMKAVMRVAGWVAVWVDKTDNYWAEY